MFRVLNPKELLLDLLRYKEELREWDIKVIYLVGPQGSGKTVTIRYIVFLIRCIEEYVRSGLTTVATNDIRILGDKRYARYFQNNHVINLIRDDAIGSGTDARMAMYWGNIDTTQKFSGTRHTLEENYEPRGIIFMIFATQDYYRLDATIRKNATLKIFTSYIDEDFFHKMFTPDQAELMRIMTYDGMVASRFDARRFAICRTMTGDVATLEIPFISKKEISYPVIDRSIDRDEIISRLSQILLKHPKIGNLADFSKSELKGLLGLRTKEIEDQYCITLRKTDLVSAIDRASILQKLENLDSESKEDDTSQRFDPNKVLTKKQRVINAMLQEKVANIDRIIEVTGLGRKEVNDVLYKYSNFFENIVKNKGIYCLKGYNYSQLELNKYLDPSNKTPKVLEM